MSVICFSLEVTTQDPVTPAFIVTSALRTGSASGGTTSTGVVGGTLYWTMDIPGTKFKYTALLKMVKKEHVYAPLTIVRVIIFQYTLYVRPSLRLLRLNAIYGSKLV